MAELLVCTVSQVNAASVYLDTKLPKAGDVITVQADGHNWSNDERGNPNWTILTAPGVDPAALTGLLAWELPVSPPAQTQQPAQNTLQYRGFTLSPIPANPATLLQITVATVQKAVVPDPAILGIANIIG